MPHTLGLKAVGEQFAAASRVDQAWSIALEAAMRELAADAGAWIWSAPRPKVEVGSGSRVSDSGTWQQILARAGSPEAPLSIGPDAADGSSTGSLFVPVTVDSWRGWLVLGRDDGPYSDSDLAAATWIGEMARLAVVGITGRQHSESVHLRQIEALRHVTTEITSTIDLDHILRVVLDDALGALRAEAGFIALFADGSAQIYAASGYNDEDLAKIATALLEGEKRSELRGWFSAGETLYFPDFAGGPIDEVLGPIRSMLVTPVFYEQHQVGSILVQSTRSDAFTSDAVTLVEALSGQAAIAVGNARRFEEQLRRGEQMRQRAEQMSLLLEVSRTMRSERPLEDVLLDVAYAVQEGTGFDLVLISVLEGNSLRRVAGAGIPLTELEKRKRVRLRWDRVRRLFQDRFRLGQCYYIPEQFRALTEGLDVFVPDRLDVEEDLTLWHNEDVFFVPLRGSAEDIIGIMSVDRPRDGLAPTAMTAEVIEVFASQVAQIIENQRLVESLRKQVTTLQLFNELNRSITTKLDLPLVLNTVVQSVTNLLGYDFSTIFLQNRTEQAFTPMASSGYALEYYPADVSMTGEAGFIREVIHTGMPIVAEDTEDDPRFASTPIPMGSSIVVPLMAEGRSVGILTADRKQKGEFSAADVATLMALADQVSVAVDNARLFEEVKHFNEELEERVSERTQELAEALERLRFQRDRSEVLYHIASELVASLDIDLVLSQALMLLQRAVRASRSSVILLDNRTGQLSYRAAIGHAEPIPPGGRLVAFDRSTSLVGWVLEKRTSLVIPDVRLEDRFGLGEVGSALSVMAVPIVSSAGESLGIILFESPLVDVFDEAQLRLVEAAAVQLGNALNNAELYRLIREQAERLGTMLRTQQIDAAKDQAILEDIADGVMVADERGDIVLFNAAAEKILSIMRQQALGRDQTEILGLFSSDVHEWLSPIVNWRTYPERYAAGAILTRRLRLIGAT